MELKTLTGEVIDLSKLEHNSVIIVRGVRYGDTQKKLIDELQTVLPVNAAILVFGNQQNAGLEIVPEEKMNELGWYRRKRKDRIVRFIHRAKKGIKNFFEFMSGFPTPDFPNFSRRK